MSDNQIITTLYPKETGLKLTAINCEQGQIHLTLTSTHKTVTCPLCNSPTSSLHSRYSRHPNDLSTVGYALRLTLNVRRFRCLNTTCERRVFAERIPDVIAVQARKTVRLQHWIAQVGLELGGEAGRRLVQATACTASGDTILRIVSALPEPKLEIPKAIGIDEFAFKRGHTYGTVIVNLETGKPIDLLKDREVATVSQWLKEHPGAKYIARDRSTAFAEAITQGAPEAEQVLDRWHVLKNLYAAFENQLKRVQKSVDEISQVFKTEPWLGPFQRSQKELETQQVSLEIRRARQDKIRALHNKGMNVSAIVRELGLSRWLVYQAIRTDALSQVRVTKRRPSNLDPWLGFLKLRWEQGVRNAKQLWQELRSQGYTGSHAQVMRWARLRKDVDAGTSSEAKGETKRRLTARQLVWILLKKPTPADTAEQASRTEFVRLLEQANPIIASARAVVLEFLHGLREKNAATLESWFANLTVNADLGDLRAFAVGLERDRKALEAAFSLPWSNGPTEGAVTRIKLIKRQGYGRAGFALLRRRVLLAA